MTISIDQLRASRQHKKQIIAQQVLQREAVINKINLLLKENQMNDVSVDHLAVFGFIIVWFEENAKDEDINKVAELLKSNGAIEKGKGKLSMDNVEFYLERN